MMKFFRQFKWPLTLLVISVTITNAVLITTMCYILYSVEPPATAWTFVAWAGADALVMILIAILAIRELHVDEEW